MLVRIPKNRDDVVTLKPGFDFGSPEDCASFEDLDGWFLRDEEGKRVTKFPELLDIVVNIQPEAVCEHGINLNAQRCPKCQTLVEKESE